MKSIVLGITMASIVATTAFAESQRTPRMSEKQLRDDLIVSTQSTQGSSAGIWLPLLMLAIIAAAAASSGGDHYVHAVEAYSDARLKTDITRVGTSPDGFGIYQFRYRGDSNRFEGVMAQDVQKHRPDAVRMAETGFLMVDYSKVDVTPKLLP
ncbi:tail fiber domain-containing protein [Salipiger sp. P9]|uniref:tail fiber domain-containing protein n=1 Tax=Salipiger pentaromativorans TaxID=2943193 RepID=UPI002157DF69|nr:tail fiber domain-containing protein [Salipiger pentaromativorans]MCR8546214.1 tail fiber domain-containing protein [Salipiger pentaromativorans]